MDIVADVIPLQAAMKFGEIVATMTRAVVMGILLGAILARDAVRTEVIIARILRDVTMVAAVVVVAILSLEFVLFRKEPLRCAIVWHHVFFCPLCVTHGVEALAMITITAPWNKCFFP